MYKLFDIRHVKLQFKIRFLEEGYVPQDKVSAIRGGIGEMLLRMNCIGRRDCENCSFRNECIVQRIYYHKPAIVPDFVTEKGNMGYLFECDNAYKYVEKGTVMEFSMLLLGDNIVNFSSILQAVYQFGMYGIGREGISFEIISIVNHRNESILYENNVRMDLLYPDYISDYIQKRIREEGISDRYSLRFETPWSQKYQGKFIHKISSEPFVDAVYRRCYLAHCMEGIPMNRAHPFRNQMHITKQKSWTDGILRYSSTHEEKIALKGIAGKAVLEDVSEEFLPYLFAAELLHIGKNTSMGFGKYTVKAIDE